MATTKPVSGANVKNDGATVLHAGNIGSSRFTNLSLATTLDNLSKYGSQVIEAVSPAESSNLGTLKPLSDGVFGQMETGEYVGKVIGTRIAQTNSSFLRSCGAETSSRTMLHYAKGNYRYDITGWSYTTGAATKGGNAGDSFTYVDPETGNTLTSEAEPTADIPGRLVYKEAKNLPVQDTYKPRTA